MNDNVHTLNYLAQIYLRITLECLIIKQFDIIL